MRRKLTPVNEEKQACWLWWPQRDAQCSSRVACNISCMMW